MEEVVKQITKFIEGELSDLDNFWIPKAETDPSKSYFEGMRQGYSNALRQLKSAEKLESLLNK